MRNASLFALALGLLGACAPSVITNVFIPLPARADDAPLAVFASKRPTCAYDDVGQVIVTDGGAPAFVPEGKLTPAVMRAARRMGGDAIIDLARSAETDGAVAVGNIVNAKRTTRQTATVIRFRDTHCVE